MKRVRLPASRAAQQAADRKIRRLPVRPPALRRHPVIVAGALLGAGLGGLAGVILLGAALGEPGIAAGWTYPVLAWLLTALGVAALWRTRLARDVLWSTRLFAGALLVGWGVTEIAAGLIAHFALGVRAGPADLLLDALGLVLLLLGWALLRAELAASRREEPPRTPSG